MQTFDPNSPTNYSSGPQQPQQPPVQHAQTGQAQPAVQALAPYYPKPRSSLASRILLAIGVAVFLASLMMNFFLIVLLSAQTKPGRLATSTIRDGKSSQTIAVYNIEGVIDAETVQRFSMFFHQVSNDGNIKAVVLRVNSPGGGLTTSDEIYEMVRQLRAKSDKVVVISMSAVAASGGYYISAPANEIFAEPTTITGSIGVIATWPVIEETLDKIGVDMVVMKSAHARGWKDAGSMFRLPNQRERAYIQNILDTMQVRFEDVVKKGRKTKLKTKTNTFQITVGQGEQARQVAYTETEPLNGKIYMADEALQCGLIDNIGYESAAIDRAAELADLSDPNVVRYHRRPSFFERIMSSKSSSPLLSLDRKTLEELQTPRIMLMWKVQ